MESRHYRHLHVWQRSRDLAVDVFRITDGPTFRRDWRVRDQMRGSALSVPANIAEGNDRGSDRDGVRFLFIARASLAELTSHLEIVTAAGLIDSHIAARWTQEADQIARMLAALIRARGSTLDKQPR